MAKGYKFGRSKVFAYAKQAVLKAGIHAYRDRKLKKRTFRQLWTNRMSAALRAIGLNYSRFINMMFKKEIVLNRKMVSEIAYKYPDAFSSLVEKVKQ